MRNVVFMRCSVQPGRDVEITRLIQGNWAIVKEVGHHHKVPRSQLSRTPSCAFAFPYTHSQQLISDQLSVNEFVTQHISYTSTYSLENCCQH